MGCVASKHSAAGGRGATSSGRGKSANGNALAPAAFPPEVQAELESRGLDEEDGSEFNSEAGASDASDWDDYLVQQSETLFARGPVHGVPHGPGASHRTAWSNSSIPEVRDQQQQGMSIFGLNDRQRLETLKETSSLKLSKLRGCTFVNQYVVIKYLGRGASGRVFLCMDINNNQLYAVKIVKKGALEAQLAVRPGAGGGGGGTNGTSDAPAPGSGHKRRRTVLEDLLAEISVMSKLKHRNIVTLREVVDDPGSNKLLLVMDYMEGGPVLTRDALDKGHRIPETVARQYFRDMVKALDYLHHNKIVHGDLKPENVLMSARGNVALSDFGCSKVIGVNGDDTLERCNGTPAFLAPEMMKPNAKYRGRPADIYALGACLFTFVFGRIPFNASSVAKLFQVVQTEPLRFPTDIDASPDLVALLSGMLEKDPDRRLTLRQAMSHPWVTLEGRWPCRSIRDLKSALAGGDEAAGDVLDTLLLLGGEGVEHVGSGPSPVDFMATANVVDLPQQDFLAGLVGPAGAGGGGGQAGAAGGAATAAAATTSGSGIGAVGTDGGTVSYGEYGGGAAAGAGTSTAATAGSDDGTAGAGASISGEATAEVRQAQEAEEAVASTSGGGSDTPPWVQRINFADGQYLMRQGETGTSMLYIVEGEVDVVIKLRSLGARPPPDSKAAGGGGGSAAIGTAGAPTRSHGGSVADASEAGDMGEGAEDTPVEELPPTIVEAALRAQEVTSKLRVGKREFLVAVRHGGTFVGEMELFSAPPVRCASVRARGPVQAVLVPLEHLVAYLEVHPEAKNQLQQMLWSRLSENLVLEALAHLAAITDVLEDLMTTVRDMSAYSIE